MLYRAVFIKNTNFDKKVPGNFRISEIPKKSFPRNPEKFSRHFPKFPDFPEILGFFGNVEIFPNFRKVTRFVFPVHMFSEYVTRKHSTYSRMCCKRHKMYTVLCILNACLYVILYTYTRKLVKRTRTVKLT